MQTCQWSTPLTRDAGDTTKDHGFLELLLVDLDRSRESFDASMVFCAPVVVHVSTSIFVPQLSFILSTPCTHKSFVILIDKQI